MNNRKKTPLDYKLDFIKINCPRIPLIYSEQYGSYLKNEYRKYKDQDLKTYLKFIGKVCRNCVKKGKNKNVRKKKLCDCECHKSTRYHAEYVSTSSDEESSDDVSTSSDEKNCSPNKKGNLERQDTNNISNGSHQSMKKAESENSYQSLKNSERRKRRGNDQSTPVSPQKKTKNGRVLSETNHYLNDIAGPSRNVIKRAVDERSKGRKNKKIYDYDDEQIVPREECNEMPFITHRRMTSFPRDFQFIVPPDEAEPQKSVKKTDVLTTEDMISLPFPMNIKVESDSLAESDNSLDESGIDKTILCLNPFNPHVKKFRKSQRLKGKTRET